MNLPITPSKYQAAIFDHLQMQFENLLKSSLSIYTFQLFGHSFYVTFHLQILNKIQYEKKQF